MNSFYVTVPHNDVVYEFAIFNHPQEGQQVTHINYYPYPTSIPVELEPDSVPSEVWTTLLEKLKSS